MRILFTGASSFTGCWFVEQLAAAGHRVVAVFQKPRGAYDGVRRERVDRACNHAAPQFELQFGDERFLGLIECGGPWDVLCHHAADVTDYKSPDFNVVAAVESNTRSVARVLKALRDRGCRRVVLTGSVFEPGEGAGSEGLPAFSPYGLSKGLTAEMFRYYCDRQGCGLTKFVIPNPFGPLEEPRFTAYLMKTWAAGQVAAVKTPEYVRDNIHVSLLARAYAVCVSQSADHGFDKCAPSAYVESQGAFAERFAAAMRPRLGLACGLEQCRQTDWAEPRIRINTTPATSLVSEWHEPAAWDAVAEYYSGLLKLR
ncbi:UDP-glucose 4-epimerase [Phycisphaerae bacterium RAS1]|nr:UDP-glucose 4-epimerase [Phycisphaerae bacterium RAS1]